MLKVGVIADDFTGATDIASFLVAGGLRTIQLTGADVKADLSDVDAVVISGKTRSCPKEEAVAKSLQALRYLKSIGCRQIYFKYCSTFDSTKEGNIGPVTDALMKEMNCDFTVFSPALPVNGRTVYKGYLFAGDCLLEESGMRNHPITPMTDSCVKRLVEMQSQGRCAVIDLNTVEQGAQAICQKINELKKEGYAYAVVDAVKEEHLKIQGEAFADLPLVTGGSGLAKGIAEALTKDAGINLEAAQAAGRPKGKKAVAISGSCSVMTNRQVAKYRSLADSMEIDVSEIMSSVEGRQAYVDKAVDFALQHSEDKFAPLLFATSNPEKLHAIQKQYGGEASAHAVEQFFAEVARRLQEKGVEKFIVAGGETSGIVTQSLGVQGFHIGPVVAPGVPWVRSINSPVSLILKSGNFGDEDFFEKTQKEY